MKIIIIGAGPTGLGAAQRLNEVSYGNWALYEKNAYVGGLASSCKDSRGFTWDVGGHVLFSHYPYFDKVVEDALGGEYFEHLRESWIRVLGTWVPYPFQNNIRYLPEDALRECLIGLRNLNGIPKNAQNFREWMYTIFGSGIVKYFMQPYNEKVWGIPLERMSKNWIGERVSVVDLARIERNIAEARDDVNWGPNNKFKFPKTGGTGAIFEGIARQFPEKIKLQHGLKNINLKNHELRFANGHVERYDILINTTPLDAFVGSSHGCPDAVIQASHDLTHNSGLIVGLGFAQRRIDPKCWMYFPEDNSPFYRVTNFHNYSPYNVPDGAIDRYFSLMCETTYSNFKKVDKASIVNETIQGLINSGMMSKDEESKIISQYVIDVPYSYPVPTVERDAALNIIQPYLESYGIYSRGRFGAWKYEVGNMDHSFMQGVEVVDRFLSGSKERVLNAG